MGIAIQKKSKGMKLHMAWKWKIDLLVTNTVKSQIINLKKPEKLNKY